MDLRDPTVFAAPITALPVRRPSSGVVAIVGALSLARASIAEAQCTTSTLAVDPALAAAPRWSAAIAAMRQTLAGTDRPWHCVGASVRFVREEPSAAVLEVSLPSGTSLRRHVAAPAELTATLQAALILDELPPPPEAPPAPPPTPEPPPPASPPPQPPQGPTVAPIVAATTPPARAPETREASGRASFIEAAIDTGMRLGASPSYTSYALRATVAFRIRAWSLFAQARVEPWTHRLIDRGPGRYLLDLGVLALGATWGAALGQGRIEAGLSLATNSYTWRDQALMPGQKETTVQVRLGTLARWRSSGRGLAFTVTLDADVSPATLLEDPPGAAVPTPPWWSAGLMVGGMYGG